MSDPKGNIYIDEENYFDLYNKGGQTPHNEVLEYQALTYRVFSKGEGREWLDATKKMLADTMVSLNVNNPGIVLAEAQGMRRQILEIEKLIATHQEYINSI